MSISVAAWNCLVGWFCRGAVVAAHALGERASLSFSMCVLPRESSHTGDVAGEPASFLLPAIWGAWSGLRLIQIRLGPAVIGAVATYGVLMFRVWGVAHLWSTSGWRLANWLLFWPAWYLVANAP